MESTGSAEKVASQARTPRVTHERRIFRDLFLARLRRFHELRTTYESELTVDVRSLIDRALTQPIGIVFDWVFELRRARCSVFLVTRTQLLRATCGIVTPYPHANKPRCSAD